MNQLGMSGNHKPFSFCTFLFDFFKNSNLRFIFSTNFIEFLDLYFFIHCAPIIEKIFVPPAYHGQLAMWSLYIAYGVPPLASICFAKIGDDLGRKVTLIYSSFIMMILTVILTILPSYEQIGITSLIIFIILRLAQTVSIAGEGACAWIFAYETTPSFIQTAFTVPFISIGEPISGLFALGSFLLLFNYCSFASEEMIIRFVFAILVCFFAFIMFNRHKLTETHHFIEARQKLNTASVTFKEIYQSFKSYKKDWKCLTSIMILYPLGFIISYIFMGDLLKSQWGYSDHDVIEHNIIITIFELMLIVCGSSLAYVLELKKNFQRQYLFLILAIIGLVSSVWSYFYLSYSVPTIWGITCIQMLFLVGGMDSFIISNFYKQFQIVGRFSLAASAWSTARIIGLIFAVMPMEYLHNSGSVSYVLVFTFFSIIQITALLIFIKNHYTT